MNTRLIEHNVLSIRAGEQTVYHNEIPDAKRVYAVALIKVPAFPDDAHPESNSLSVICSERYTAAEGQVNDKPLWGWVHLTPDAKNLIGSDLVESNAEIGKWYYLVLQD